MSDQDSGVSSDAKCDPSAEPPDGGLTVAAITAPQALPSSSEWEVQSMEGDCAGIRPSASPAAALAWTDGPGSWCDDLAVDSHGTVAFLVAADQTNAPFLSATSGTAIRSATEHIVGIDPRDLGFWLSVTGKSCLYRTAVDANGARSNLPISPIPEKGGSLLSRNPAGGFVESTTVMNGAGTDSPTFSFEVRWVDDRLIPQTDWYVALTSTGLSTSMDARVFVDAQGRALVLAASSPPRFGPPPSRSAWKFTARWMSVTGALSDPFEPIPPVYSANEQFIDFAGWGSLVPMPGGGFAAFHDEYAPYPGATTTPSGWYATYAPADPPTAGAPAWLQPYGGSMQLLAGAGALAGVRSDPTSCLRTVDIISRTGRVCERITLQDSDICSSTETLTPTGTLVLQQQNGCLIRWWPNLAMLALH